MTYVALHTLLAVSGQLLTSCLRFSLSESTSPSTSSPSWISGLKKTQLTQINTNEAGNSTRRHATYRTAWTMPVTIGNILNSWFETVGVIGRGTAVATEKLAPVFTHAAKLHVFIFFLFLDPFSLLEDERSSRVTKAVTETGCSGLKKLSCSWCTVGSRHAVAWSKLILENIATGLKLNLCWKKYFSSYNYLTTTLKWFLRCHHSIWLACKYLCLISFWNEIFTLTSS